MNTQLAAANKLIAEQNRTIATLAANGNGGTAGEIMENVIIKGDLSKLTPVERAKYYARVCESIGLNPLTKPFEYLPLGGKLVLYALRACTDQLRTIHKVSVVDLTETERDGVFIVTARLQNGEGRTDMAKGAVTIQGLKGDALANAVMKAETKAKRRATLSLCGLGFLDETEIETIPTEKQTLPKKDSRDIYTKLQKEIDNTKSAAELREWRSANEAERIAVLPKDWKEILWLRYQEKLVDLQEQERASGPKQEAQSEPPPAEQPKGMPDPKEEFGAWLAWLDNKLGYLTTTRALENYWNTTVLPIVDPMFPPDQIQALELYDKHAARMEAE